MKKNIFILAISIIFLASSCEKNEDIKPCEPSLPTLDDYEVYSAVVNSKFSLLEKVVISQKSLGHVSSDVGFFEEIINNNPGFDTNLIERLGIINETPVSFEDNFICEGKEIFLLSNEEYSSIFSNDDNIQAWEDFYKLYPDSYGIREFSRIAFNENKTQAVLEIGSYVASLFGGGQIIYMVKQNGEWIVKDSVSTWIS